MPNKLGLCEKVWQPLNERKRRQLEQAVVQSELAPEESEPRADQNHIYGHEFSQWKGRTSSMV